MSTILPVPSDAPTLDGLRAELDRIDDAMHDLLVERAATVQLVGALRAKGPVPLRPGREAAILRRLLRRHEGPLPASVVVRLWREIVTAGAAMQAPFAVAVCETSDPGAAGEFTAAAREHFGALVRLRVHRTPAGAIRDVSAGVATAAVLPLPREDEPSAAAWWTSLLHRSAEDTGSSPGISIVARLPFWAPRPDGAPRAQAFVVSAAAADPSGEDRSLLGLELPPELSRARLNAALSHAGLSASHVILRRTSSSAQALAEVEGFVRDDDARLRGVDGVLRPLVVVGAYAVPYSPTPATGGGR